MLWTVFVILLILWFLGFTQVTDGSIHLMLVAATAVAGIITLHSGRRSLWL
jgi:hypothetical protein